MYQKVFQILHQELQLYRAALETERAKRRAILGADGRSLQEYSKKTETFLQEADRLEQHREAAVSKLPLREGSLSELLAAGDADDQTDSGLVTLIRDQFAPTIRDLKAETDENRRLLENSGRSVHRALTELQNRADPRDETYRPGGPRQNQSGAAVLLNANA